MTVEEIKKLDRRIREIPYPFGENYPIFRKLFAEAAEQQHISASGVIQQYIAWKYGQR